MLGFRATKISREEMDAFAVIAKDILVPPLSREARHRLRDYCPKISAVYFGKSADPP